MIKKFVAPISGFVFLFILLSASINIASAQSKTGTQVVDGFIGFMKGSSVFHMTFSFKTKDVAKNEVANLKCILILQGDYYKMINDNIEVYCDGKTKWIINNDAAEVNIFNNDVSSADAYENPLSFFTSIKDLYSVPVSSSQKLVNGVKGDYVTLVAAKGKKPTYTRINLVVNAINGHPLSIEFIAKNGYVYIADSFVIKTAENTIVKEEFRPSASKVKGFYINDLR